MIQVSVILPTYNRLQSLKRALNALFNQTVPHQQYELIVVDDGSTDGTSEYLTELSSAPVNLNFVQQTNQGPASARNAGIELAEGKILAFTDDDCEVSPNWILEVVHSFENMETVGVQGSTYSDPKSITPFTHQIENTKGNKAVPTCNAAYLKSVVGHVGGFDTEFPFPHNEDADLAWRIGQIGRIDFNENMRVYHPPRIDSFVKVARQMKYLKSEFPLFHKNPGLYRQHRSVHPWFTIYVDVFFRHITLSMLRIRKQILSPRIFFNGILLYLTWWTELILLFPQFLILNKHYGKKYNV